MNNKNKSGHNLPEGRGFALVAKAIREHAASAKEQPKSELDHRKKTNRVAWAGVVVAAIYTVVTYRIFTTTRDSVDELRRQVAIMEKSQAASLFVEVKSSPDWNFLVFTVTNYGQIAAKNVVLCGSVWVKPPDPQQPVMHEYRLGGDNSAIPPGRTPYPFGRLPLSPTVAKGTQDGIAALGIGGTIAFDTGFGNARGRQSACWEYQRGEWSPCRTFDNPITLAKESQAPEPFLSTMLSSLQNVRENCK